MVDATGTRAADAPTPIVSALGWHYPDLSDFEFMLTIVGKPITLKTSKRAISRGSRLAIVNAPSADRFLELAAQQLWAQWRTVFREPIPKHVELNAAIVTYLPTARLADASNLYQAPEDALQLHRPQCKPTCKKHGGVIVDDVQIRCHDGSDRRIDRDNPRVEIFLTPARR